MDWPARRHRVGELVAEYYLPLYRYAFRLSGTAVDAEDLTQDAFCTAQMRLHQLRDPGRVKSWLFAILRNGYLHRVREEPPRPIPLDLVGEVAEPTPDPPAAVDPDQLQAALNELPEVYRTPVILFYFENFSYREIADQMDLPIGTVMSRLARAKVFLRERFLKAPSSAESRRAAHEV